MSAMPRLFLLAFVLTSTLVGSAHAQPRATRRAFENAPLERCLVTPAFSDAEVRVSLVLHRDGTWLVAIDHTGDAVNDAGFEACAEAILFESLGEVVRPAPRRAVVLERVVGSRTDAGPRTPSVDPESLPAHDGRHGAVCRWGEHRGPEVMSYPTPRDCRAGLSCCDACGVGGCDSACQTDAECERNAGRP